ncbi:hypothetical protein ON010_g3526 [Phytophthora cinnamomi]|nr:hypothetical protein ON010_g3526 [Phytophthora cinnamomi]
MWATVGGPGAARQPAPGHDQAAEFDVGAERDLTEATREIGGVDDATLPPTVVPRRLWIPGFRRERLFRASDVTPWDVDLVSHLHVVQIDLRVLNTLLVNVSEWLLPEIDLESHPSPRTYEPLITGATVTALMDTPSPPWVDLDNNEAPLTFIPHLFGRPLPPDFAQAYLELEERHLQSYWESTHFLPITDTMCETDSILAAYHKQRRQRRSRAGAAWRRFLLKHVIPALRQRQCDLDILLDPLFLHFPKSRVPKHWFPQFTDGASTLADALKIVDLAEPWRLQYRQSPQNHPAMGIARLRDKFLDPRHAQGTAVVDL